MVLHWGSWAGTRNLLCTRSECVLHGLDCKEKYSVLKQKSPLAQKYHFTWQSRENLGVDWMLGKELSTKPGRGGAIYIIFWIWPSPGSSGSELPKKNYATEYILSFNSGTIIFGVLIPQTISQLKISMRCWQAHGCPRVSLPVQAETQSENFLAQGTWGSKSICSTNNEETDRQWKSVCFLLSMQY